jgi:serine/threonine-protein kinase
MTDLIGTRLNQYELAEIIRRGGMSTVYKAYQDSLDRFVAVKVLFSNRDPQFAARFKREARAIAALQHHNILPVYDYGEQEGLLFLVLQYIEGGTTLGDMLGKPMASPTALRLTSHVLDALDYAHKRGVIHRDIKPANVLMPSPSWPMLADFGIAKLMNDNQQRLTLANQIIGTAAYMAPEQATGRPIDARTDLYAAGIVLYELVTGRVPFDSDTPMAVLTKHVYETPPPARTLNPDLPSAVDQALQKALQKDPAARYQTAAEMSAELSQIAADLERNKNRSQITGLYEVGVQAFEQGHWDQAVDRLGKLVALDPGYEDAHELLDAAREAQERAKTEARQQIELVRQRRQSALQQPRPATDATLITPPPDAAPPPVAPRRAPAPATTKLPQLDESEPAPAEATAAPSPEAPAAPSTRPLAATPAAPSTRPLADTPAPGVAAGPASPAAPARQLPIAWIIAGVVTIVLLLALFFILRGGQPNVSGTPTAPSGAATSQPIGVGQEPTIGAATEAPSGGDSGQPAPEPAGKILLQDDFNNKADQPSALEDNLRAPDFRRGFHPPGVYHVIPPANTSSWVALPQLLVRDFAMQIRVWDDSDELKGDFSEGVIFRARDLTHFYALLIDPRNGKYTIRKYNGLNNVTDLIPWKESELVNRQKEVNVVRVDGKDDTFTLYLNGKLLDSFKDEAYPSGLFGLISANVDAVEPHPHFDDLAIWSSDEPLKLPDLPAERQDAAGNMVLIPGGEFILGGNTDPAEPTHVVSMPSFYIDRTEVTNAAYQQCIAAGRCSAPKEAGSATRPAYFDDPAYQDFPVIHVTYEQARQFCGWANKRLPSEAEWEKAAGWNVQERVKLRYPWGNEFKDALLNSAESNNGDTLKVASFEQEINGLYDMGGNVSEWTNSLDRPYPYDEADGREEYPGSGNRIFRGGSYGQTKGKSLVDNRRPAAPDYSDREIGFRCAISPPPSQ